MDASITQRVRALAALMGIAALAATPGLAAAQMGGMGGKGKGGGHADHGGGGGGAGGGGHGGHVPGAVQPMCHGGDEGDMPPHYCEPVYKVASSIAGVRIDHVMLNGEKSVSVMLKSTLAGNPRLVIVGGTGGLAGASLVAAGWRDGAHVTVDFAGSDSLYAHRHVHLHVFPVTDK